jgi:hypothetical protein
MKQFLAVIVLTVVASVCGAQQKTVKPALPLVCSDGTKCKTGIELGRCVCQPKSASIVSVKPVLSQQVITTPPIGGMYVDAPVSSFGPGPCGWYQSPDEDHLLQPDKDGVCKMSYSFHAGPDDADCRFVSSADGKTLGVTCTWKPTKDGDK